MRNKFSEAKIIFLLHFFLSFKDREIFFDKSYFLKPVKRYIAQILAFTVK
jgi:hypothetical protein